MNKPVDRPTDVFAQLANSSPFVVADYLKNEAPETAAATLMLMPPEAAAQVLNLQPRTFRHRTLRCMAANRPMAAPAMGILASVLGMELLGARQVPVARAEEVRTIVALLPLDMRDTALAALDEPFDALVYRNYPIADPSPNGEETPAKGFPKTGIWQTPCPHSMEMEFEQLSLLEVVYDRLVNRLATSLRGLTGNNIEVTLERIVARRYDEYINPIPLPAILSVFRFEEWQANGKLVADPLLIEAVCVSLLGSRNANGAISQGRRPFTTIERDLFQLFVSTVLGDLAAAFTWVSDPVEVRLDRLETNPRFTYIAEMNDLVTVARLHINIAGDDDGRCDVVIPYSAFETRKEAYLRTTRPPTRRPPLAAVG